MHPQAERLAAGHAGRLAAAAPGLLVALHVVGSAVLDDYLPGRSDLDVVGELGREPTGADLAALAAVHREWPMVEAVYVTSVDLDGPVSAAATGPWALEGRLDTTERAFGLNPVTWQQLRDHAETVFGRPPHPVVDAGEVAAFCRANLGEYWLPLLDRAAAKIEPKADDEPIPADIVVWMALGPPRLWHTVTTGEIVSKSRAGRLAAASWPDLAAPLAEIVEAHRRPDTTLSARHARAAVTLGRRAATAAGAG